MKYIALDATRNSYTTKLPKLQNPIYEVLDLLVVRRISFQMGIAVTKSSKQIKSTNLDFTLQ